MRKIVRASSLAKSYFRLTLPLLTLELGFQVALGRGENKSCDKYKAGVLSLLSEKI